MLHILKWFLVDLWQRTLQLNTTANLSTFLPGVGWGPSLVPFLFPECWMLIGKPVLNNAKCFQNYSRPHVGKSCPKEC